MDRAFCRCTVVVIVQKFLRNGPKDVEFFCQFFCLGDFLELVSCFRSKLDHFNDSNKQKNKCYNKKQSFFFTGQLLYAEFKEKH